MEQLKSRLRERHQIAVAVYSTPAAESVLAKNGLSIVDFLRPMALVNKLNGQQPCRSLSAHSACDKSQNNRCFPLAVPMRVGEMSYRVQEVQLGLYAGDSMYQPKPEVRRWQCLRHHTTLQL